MRFSSFSAGCMLLCLLCAMPAQADSVVLAESVSFATDDWYPLPESEIKRAVADKALSVLTQGTTLRIVRGDKSGDGRIVFAISLIGSARTAKATIEIDSPRTGSLVSTASVSLADMNHEGIFHAFEHIGSEAASRMIAQVKVRLEEDTQTDADAVTNAKLQRLYEKAQLDGDAQTVADVGAAVNAELQRLYERATALKRSADFPGAKEIFLRIVQHAGPQAGNWPELAADEIRYGLPMYHAQYLLTGGGRFTVDPDAALSNLDVAENLLRQVYAENAGSVPRVQEAQSMLDGIQIGRNAMRRAMQASWLSQVTPLRLILSEAIMSEGICPDKAALDKMTSYLPDSVAIDRISGGDESRTYHLQGPESDLKAVLECDIAKFPQPIQLRTE